MSKKAVVSKAARGGGNGKLHIGELANAIALQR